MNILYISSEYPPETGYGGIATYTGYIARAMAQLGHTVSVITSSIDDKRHLVSCNGVTIYRVPPTPFPLPPFRFAFPFRRIMIRLFFNSLVRLSWILAVRAAIRHLLKRCPNFDIIEAPDCGGEGLLIPAHSATCRIVRFHTPWELIVKLDKLNERAGDRFLLPVLEKIAACHADAVSAPSNAMRLYIEKTWHIRHVTVLPNPLPVDSFQKSSGNGWIYIGRIERRKGVHHLLAAYKRFIERCPHPPHLTLIGASYDSESSARPYGNIIRDMISVFPLDLVRWIDHLPHDKMPVYMQQSSVAFFPSLWENYPYACLEAMACSCAVVASNCGGFPEIIVDTVHGLLVVPDCEESLYNAMQVTYNNPDRVVLWRNAARERVAEIASTSHIGKATEQFYMQVLEKKRETVNR